MDLPDIPVEDVTEELERHLRETNFQVCDICWVWCVDILLYNLHGIWDPSCVAFHGILCDTPFKLQASDEAF